MLFIVYIVLYCVIYEGRVGIPLTGLPMPHFCACPEHGPRFATSYSRGLFFYVHHLRWEVIVHFVDIGQIVDHHCLNFLFMIKIRRKVLMVANITKHNRKDDDVNLGFGTGWETNKCGDCKAD